MEKERVLPKQEPMSSPSLVMFRGVTRIVGLHQYADICVLHKDKKAAQMSREKAFMLGMRVVALTEVNEGYKKALENALIWLGKRDYEMYENVQETLDQAKAAREMMRINRRSLRQ